MPKEWNVFGWGRKKSPRTHNLWYMDLALAYDLLWLEEAGVSFPFFVLWCGSIELIPFLCIQHIGTRSWIDLFECFRQLSIVISQNTDVGRSFVFFFIAKKDFEPVLFRLNSRYQRKWREKWLRCLDYVFMFCRKLLSLNSTQNTNRHLLATMDFCEPPIHVWLGDKASIFILILFTILRLLDDYDTNFKLAYSFCLLFFGTLKTFCCCKVLFCFDVRFTFGSTSQSKVFSFRWCIGC